LFMGFIHCTGGPALGLPIRAVPFFEVAIPKSVENRSGF
jgi:hypothetical protein